MIEPTSFTELHKALNLIVNGHMKLKIYVFFPLLNEFLKILDK